tara:strand:+ start:1897 stop:2106 length:210 start_codon:yes stop_codon:yes gene_type:complete
MPKITNKKTADILEYRRNYYQENKAKISKYQKEYYRLKKGLRPDHNLNWRGEKMKGMTRTYGEYKMVFD